MLSPFEIISILNHDGHETYIVGGFVRDYLLDTLINGDMDIVTSATPDEVIDVALKNKADKVNTVGKSFGVVVIDNTEVATYRKDKYNGTGNNNLTVKYASSLREDLARRDLTINAIAMTAHFNIIDPFNYKKDVENRLIKFVGVPSDRIKEDPVRMIRACRFLAKIDGRFDKESFQAIQKNNNLIDEVPKERIRLEILKTMRTISRASKFFIIMFQTGLLKKTLLSLTECAGIKQNTFHIESVFTHNMFTGDTISTRFPLLKLAGYLHDIGKPPTKKQTVRHNIIDYSFLEHEDKGCELAKKDLEALKFSTEEVSLVSGLIKHHMRTVKTPRSLRRTLHQLEIDNISFKDFMRLKIADGLGKRPKVEMSLSELKTVLKTYKEIINNKNAVNTRQLAVDGHDIMRILNILPSKDVGIALKNLLEMVMDEPEFNTKEVLETVLEYWKEHGLPASKIETDVVIPNEYE